MSPLSKDAKIGFAIVAIFLIVAAGVLISINLLAPREPPLTGELDVQVINGDTVLELDFDSLLTISATVPGATVEGASSYQNRFGNWRDAGTYAGIKLATIIELSGGMGVNDVIRVNASDGYAQYYSYANLYPNSTETTLQGDLILAYVYNGTTPSSWSDGPRTAFIPADGAYSNDDANQTTHPAWFYGSAGARWIRNVASIEVLQDLYFESTLHFTVIDGDDKRDVYLFDLALMNNIEGFAAYQTKSGSWGGNGTYTGVNLSTIIELLSTIDNNDVVNVSSNDGYSQAFAYYNIYPNSSIYAIQGDLILAYIYNGTITPSWVDGPRLAFLTPDGSYSIDDAAQTTHPTWFFGSGGARWVSNVLQIEIHRDSYPP